MSPLPRTTVIPPGWSAHHRPVVAQTFGAQVAIRHPGTKTAGEFNPDTGRIDDAVPNDPHFTGKARIQILPITGGDRETGEQRVTIAGYRVSIDLVGSEECLVGDILKVTGMGDNGDPAMVNHELNVSLVEGGSVKWERNLTVLDNLG